MRTDFHPYAIEFDYLLPGHGVFSILLDSSGNYEVSTPAPDLHKVYGRLERATIAVIEGNAHIIERFDPGDILGQFRSRKPADVSARELFDLRSKNFCGNTIIFRPGIHLVIQGRKRAIVTFRSRLAQLE